MTAATRCAVLVLGAGHAAGVLARSLRDLGFRGSITLVGDEGYPPYERPPLSKGILLSKQTAQESFLADLDWYAQADVRLILSRRAVKIDPHRREAILDDGTHLGYENLVFATGARPRRLNVPGAGQTNVRVLRNIADTLAIAPQLRPGARVCVIGAGLLGLEIAAAARQMACHVSVIEAAPRALMRVLPAGIAAYITSLHAGRGVDLRFEKTVIEFRGHERLVEVALSDGDTMVADLVVVAIGAVANDELARAAGLSVRDGIAVDASCRASTSGIYAIGDVARHVNSIFGTQWRLESWQNAQNQAQLCARVICGEAAAYAEVPWFWTDQYDCNVQFAGLTTDGLRPIRRGDTASGSFSLFCLDGDVVRGVVGVNRPRDVRAAKDLIGQRRRVNVAILADEKRSLKEAALAAEPEIAP